MRRYLLKEIFNITTSDDRDDDGNAAGGSLLINDDQLAELNDLITEVSADRDNFLLYCGVENLEQLPASRYDKAKRALEAKRSL